MAAILGAGSLFNSFRSVSQIFRPLISQPFNAAPRPSPFLLPALILPALPTIDSIWESILRAVPKKKTSHMKKRHRQMAGKALKDVTALNKCPACGNTKRAHLLCPHCVASIQKWFGSEAKAAPPGGP